MAQILLPDSDIATGSWSTTPLWSKVDDDSTVNPSGDGTTVASDNNTSPDNADLGLASGTDPESSTGHVLRARWNKDSTGGHVINAVLELWEGTPGTGTLIATLSVSDVGASEVESTYTLTGTEADSITDYTNLNLRLSRQGDNGGPPNGRRSLVADLVEFEIPDAAAATGRLEASWAELEAPDLTARLEASWAEVETPESPTRLEASWAEVESPDSPTRFEASWVELEAPESPTRIEVSWVEVESPESPTRLEVSWGETEVPDSPTGIGVSWAEVEVPEVSTRIETSWVEFEVPESPTRFETSWAEFETPELGAQARLETSWVELETPDVVGRVEASWVEFEVPDSPVRLEASFAALEVPTVGGGESHPGDLTLLYVG